MVRSMKRWSGKVAVVTGASSGIGAAIVDALVANGLQVVGIARRVELVEAKAKKLQGTIGRLHAFKADVSKEEDVLRAFKWIKENLGPIHVVINNAGVFPHANLFDISTEDLQKTFDLNVLGLSVVTREAIQTMIPKKIEGHIIHINSILGHSVINFPGMNVYPATKHAVTALTETLRQELARIGSKIKVTSISPGAVVSEMSTLNKDNPPERQAHLESIPIMNPEDIADAVVYVLSTPKHVQALFAPKKYDADIPEMQAFAHAFLGC